MSARKLGRLAGLVFVLAVVSSAASAPRPEREHTAEAPARRHGAGKRRRDRLVDIDLGLTDRRAPPRAPCRPMRERDD